MPKKSIPDGSLEGKQYLELGIPASDRSWVHDDMKLAADSLKTLVAGHPEQLPRFESPKSGVLFARIVHPGNLEFFRNKGLPIQSRMSLAVAFMEAQNSLFGTYYSAFLQQHCSDADIVELLGAQLRGLHMLVDLTDEILPTLPADHSTNPARMKGLQKMKNGLALSVIGAITVLTEDEAYSTAARLKLLEYCRAEFPAIVPKLLPDSRTEIKMRLDKLTTDPKLLELRPQLLQLRDETAAATEKP